MKDAWGARGNQWGQKKSKKAVGTPHFANSRNARGEQPAPKWGSMKRGGGEEGDGSNIIGN